MKPPRSFHMAVPGADLFVREAGGGSPIVAVHGGPDFDHSYLLPELDILGERFRVICYDQRGRGRSTGADDAADVTIESEVADLDAVISWAGRPLTLLGHSWGAVLALEYAVRHPERVAQLVLASPAPISAGGARATRESIAASRSPAESARLAELRADAAWHAGDLGADMEYHRIHFRIALARSDDLERVVSRLRAHFSPAAIVKARAIEERLYELTWARQDYDLTPRLAPLTLPTLVLHGEDDLIPTSVARGITDSLPNAELQIIAGAGHFAYLEQPRRFADAVAAFLERAA